MRWGWGGVCSRCLSCCTFSTFSRLPDLRGRGRVSGHGVGVYFVILILFHPHGVGARAGRLHIFPRACVCAWNGRVRGAGRVYLICYRRACTCGVSVHERLLGVCTCVGVWMGVWSCVGVQVLNIHGRGCTFKGVCTWRAEGRVHG